MTPTIDGIMPRCAIFLFALFLMSVQSSAADTISIGNAPQLFVDDYAIAESSGLVHVVQQPRRVSERPILTSDQAWEGSVLQAPCVLWDPRMKFFHMYYWSATGDSIFTCYATSTDGVHWEKPTLNLHAGLNGSKENNIVLRGKGNVARIRYVEFNPNTNDPQRRFLALYIDNVPGLTEFSASSPDGLHWKTEKKIGDLRHVTGGEVTSNPPFFLIEQQWVSDPNDGHRYRGIWRTESRDMQHWTGGQAVVQRLPDDDPDLEFYHACSHFIGSRTHNGLHFGYLYLFHSENSRGVRDDGVRLAGTIDTALMVSRDTIHWKRLDRHRRFFPLGPAGSWEAAMNFVSPEVIHGDRMLFYYSGWSQEHASSQNRASIGLATLPLDRFVSIEPKQQRGSLTTKPFVVRGNGLFVNVDASHGELRIEVLDEQGQVVPGYQESSCKPISSDEPRAEVKWRGKSWGDLAKRTICLRFRLVNASLFAFDTR